jgi:hypothetical protein
MPIRKITSLRNLPRKVLMAATIQIKEDADGGIRLEQSYNKDSKCEVFEAYGADKVGAYFDTVVREGLTSEAVYLDDVDPQNGGKMCAMAVAISERVTIKTMVAVETVNASRAPVVLFMLVEESDHSLMKQYVQKLDDDTEKIALEYMVDYIMENGPWSNEKVGYGGYNVPIIKKK